jgi:hypothetical protein
MFVTNVRMGGTEGSAWSQENKVFSQGIMYKWSGKKRNTVKVLFFVGINFRGFVKNYMFVDSWILLFVPKTKYVDFIFST